ncbi:hypothetical protein Hanom_Chr03g00186801 [Helianthus anomalus]
MFFFIYLHWASCFIAPHRLVVDKSKHLGMIMTAGFLAGSRRHRSHRHTHIEPLHREERDQGRFDRLIR